MFRKIGCYFFEDYLEIQYLFHYVTIKYEYIDRIIFYKLNFKNWVLTLGSMSNGPSQLHIYLKAGSPMKERYYAGIFKYKNFGKMPKSLRRKTTIID